MKVLKKPLSITRVLRTLAAVSIFCLVCAGAWGQAQPPSAYPAQIVTFGGAPFGVCDVYQVALDVTTGNFYPCNPKTRSWLLAGNSLLSSNNTITGTNNATGPWTFTNGITTNSLTDSGLTSGNCVQATSGGQLTTVSGPCGTSSGTITATGSPASGNLTKFSGATSITNGDLSGDCTTSGTLASTCTKTNGTAFAASATTDTTNAGNISSGTLSAGRIPATTSNCSGSQFAQGLNAGMTPICATPASGATAGCTNNTPVTVSNTVSASNLLSCSIAANALSAGSVLHVNFSGVESSASGANYTPNMTINLGGGTSCTTATGTTAAGNNQPWNIVATLAIITAGSGGTANWSCEYLSSLSGGGVSGPSGVVGAPTISINTTISNTLQTQVSMSVANAGNSVTGQVLKAVIF